MEGSSRSRRTDDRLLELAGCQLLVQMSIAIRIGSFGVDGQSLDVPHPYPVELAMAKVAVFHNYLLAGAGLSRLHGSPKKVKEPVY